MAQGHSVKSVCSSGKHGEQLRRDGYDIEMVPVARSLSPFKGLVTIWRLFCFFRRESFDVVHVHTPIAAFLGRIAAFFARVPFVVYTAHGFYFHDIMINTLARNVVIKMFIIYEYVLIYVYRSKDIVRDVIYNFIFFFDTAVP